MNARKVTMMAAVLSVGLFTFAESAGAQEELAGAQSDCRRVKAQRDWVFVTGTGTGTITEGGRLNGTTLEVFVPGVLPTQDPTTITFIADFTLTTNRGQLNASNVYLADVAAGVGAALWRIDPTSSTGRFAGATGVLHAAVTNISLNPDTFHEEITGVICFSNQARNEGDQDK